MIEALKNDELVKKVGGPFRLTALVQRRLKELIEGARPLVDVQGMTMVEVAVTEIMEDKIMLDYEKSHGLEPPEQGNLETDGHLEKEE